MKTCTKCNEKKPYTEFYKSAKMKDGYKSRCIQCQKHDQQDYLKRKELGISLNKAIRTEELLSRGLIYCPGCKQEKNKDEFGKHSGRKTGHHIYCKECRKQRSLNLNRSEINKKNREYYYNNHKANRDKINKRRQERKETDILYLASKRARDLVIQSIKRKGYSKNSKTYKILGVSYREFIIHIESNFEPWMNWSNNHLWDIDHNIPLNAATTEEEVLMLCHYSNLRPLKKETNRYIKRGSYNSSEASLFFKQRRKAA